MGKLKHTKSPLTIQDLPSSLMFMRAKIKTYWPLLVVFFAALFLTIASRSEFSSGLMGFFLCLLAMLKLFDLSAFASGFRLYDIIAKRSRLYALIYPFIELTLGLLFISNLIPLITNIITFIIMTIGLISVIKSLKSGLDIRCACLGTSLNIPLSTVTIIENAAMALMSLINIIYFIINYFLR